MPGQVQEQELPFAQVPEPQPERVLVLGPELQPEQGPVPGRGRAPEQALALEPESRPGQAR